MRFSFHRGSLALDFIGTVGNRRSAQPQERLPDPAALKTWLDEAGLPVPARLGQSDLSEALALREALYRLGQQTVDGEALDRRALARVNRAALGAYDGGLQIGRDASRRWRTRNALRLSLGRIAEDGIVRLTEDRNRLIRCELPHCGALLLSRSRGDPRRWCSMELCGNRAKVAAFRARQRRQ